MGQEKGVRRRLIQATALRKRYNFNGRSAGFALPRFFAYLSEPGPDSVRIRERFEAFIG
jgi:hypothetical protein